MLCSAITSRGSRCGAHAMRDSDFCFSHSPEVARERTQARRRGGVSGGRGRPKSTPELEWAKQTTRWVIDALRSGELDPSLGGVASQGVNTYRGLLRLTDRHQSLREEAQGVRLLEEVAGIFGAEPRLAFSSELGWALSMTKDTIEALLEGRIKREVAGPVFSNLTTYHSLLRHELDGVDRVIDERYKAVERQEVTQRPGRIG
jgi:hypothetical protein